MKRLRLSVWRAWGGAGALLLASSCGLTTEGADLYEIIEESDASVDDDHDSGVSRDAASGGKDAAADTGDLPDVDAGADGDAVDAHLDAETDADTDDDADTDADTDEDADADLDGGDLDVTTPPDDADAEEPLPDAGVPDSGSLCCEGDPNVFSGQTAFFTVPNKCGNFDYNCDGVEQKELGLGKACSRPFWENRCDAPQIGFKDKVPECGKPGIKFVGCTGRTWNAGCNSVEEAVLQGCR